VEALEMGVDTSSLEKNIRFQVSLSKVPAPSLCSFF